MTQINMTATPQESTTAVDTDSLLVEELLEDEMSVPAFGDNEGILIKSTAFTLQFHPLRYGDTVVSLVQGTLFSSGLLNSIAQTTSREGARELFSLHQGLFGDLAVAKGTTGNVDHCFNPDFTLKAEHYGTKTDQQINRLELRYAALRAIIDAALDIELAWRTIFANAPSRLDSGPQYSLQQNTDPDPRQPRWIPGLQFESSLKYYYDRLQQVKKLRKIHSEDGEHQIAGAPASEFKRRQISV